jgi:P27 family predicted phage terminase small subunit
MPPRGRKPKPTPMKVVAGTARPGRINNAEPDLPPSRPPPPDFLSKEAKDEWERVIEGLYRSGIMTFIDVGALAAYCQSYGRWLVAEEALSKFAERDPATRGIMLKTQSGNAIQNPLVGAANTAMAAMVRYAAEFGMTPSSRARVNGDTGGQKESAAARFLK